MSTRCAKGGGHMEAVKEEMNEGMDLIIQHLSRAEHHKMHHFK